MGPRRRSARAMAVAYGFPRTKMRLLRYTSAGNHVSGQYVGHGPQVRDVPSPPRGGRASSGQRHRRHAPADGLDARRCANPHASIPPSGTPKKRTSEHSPRQRVAPTLPLCDQHHVADYHALVEHPVQARPGCRRIRPSFLGDLRGCVAAQRCPLELRGRRGSRADPGRAAPPRAPRHPGDRTVPRGTVSVQRSVRAAPSPGRTRPLSYAVTTAWARLARPSFDMTRLT